MPETKGATNLARYASVLNLFALVSFIMDPVIAILVAIAAPYATMQVVSPHISWVEQGPLISDFGIGTFLEFNFFSTLTVCFGGIAAAKYESRLGAFLCGMGVTVLLFRIVFFQWAGAISH